MGLTPPAEDRLVRAQRVLPIGGRDEAHAAVLDRRVVDGTPHRGGPGVGGVGPVRHVLVPGEHGVFLERLLGEQLVVVDLHPATVQLCGDRQRPLFEDVALPGRVVAAWDHHVDDRVVRRVAPVVAGHVAVVLAGHLDLAAQEPVVDDLQVGHLGLAEQARQVDEAVAVEGLDLLGGDGVAAVGVPRAHGPPEVT
jgi:hypothetical protein